MSREKGSNERKWATQTVIMLQQIISEMGHAPVAASLKFLIFALFFFATLLFAIRVCEILGGTATHQFSLTEIGILFCILCVAIRLFWNGRSISGTALKKQPDSDVGTDQQKKVA